MCYYAYEAIRLFTQAVILGHLFRIFTDFYILDSILFQSPILQWYYRMHFLNLSTHIDIIFFNKDCFLLSLKII